MYDQPNIWRGVIKPNHCMLSVVISGWFHGFHLGARGLRGQYAACNPSAVETVTGNLKPLSQLFWSFSYFKYHLCCLFSELVQASNLSYMASCHFPTTPFQFGGWFKLQMLHLSLFNKSVLLLSCIAAHTLNHSTPPASTLWGLRGNVYSSLPNFCVHYICMEKKACSQSVFCCCNETVISNMRSVVYFYYVHHIHAHIYCCI